MSASEQAAVARTVKTQDGAITYELTRKRVKNLNLRVGRDGGVRVSAPARTSLACIDAFVASRSDLIRKAKERLRGEQNRIETMPDVPEEMCRQRFQAVLDSLLPRLEGFTLPPVVLKLRTMKSRWGSCAWTTGTVTLNRRLYFAPPECLEYVALHELCHFVHHDHSPRFHALLDRLMPDWKQRKALLERWNTGAEEGPGTLRG